MLKLIAPFRALFNLDSPLVAAHPAEFIEFLKFLRAEVADGTPGKQTLPAGVELEVNLPNSDNNSGVASRYQSMDTSGSQYISPKIFTLHFNPSEKKNIGLLLLKAAHQADAEVFPFSGQFHAEPESLSLAFYDNTVAILSLDLTLDKSKTKPGDRTWDKLDQWTTHLVHHLLNELYPKFIFPALRAVTAFSHELEKKFMLDVEQYRLFMDLVGKPENPYPDLENRFLLMWVNRTLLYTEDYPLNHWIRSCIRKEGIIPLDRANLHLNWGNNVVMLPLDMDKEDLFPLWRGILSAQYYYAAMDAVSSNLIQYIGLTFNRQSTKALRQLSVDIESTISSVTILQFRYKDIYLEVQGIAGTIFHHLEREWHFDTLAANVQSKINVCESNLTNLTRETNARNEARTQLVLSIVAGFGIVNLMVDLAAYVAQLTPEQKLTMVGSMPGFIDLGFLFSSNTLTWIGILMAAGIALITLQNRKT